ncbi:MAG TPA: hypothetical protein PK566_10295 [Pseudobacteroides sp.]|nr:hypothetical protein [Pseudobacteroides sp.]
MFETSLVTKKGVEVSGLAEVEINGTKLILKHVVVYPKGDEIKNVVGARDILQWQKQVSKMAKQQGFTELRIQGIRMPNSTSAKPGKVVNYSIDLMKLKD